MLSPAERRTLAEIERRLAQDHPELTERFAGRAAPAAHRGALAARILIGVLAVVGVVAGVVVARVDIVAVCALVLVAWEVGHRRLRSPGR